MDDYIGIKTLYHLAHAKANASLTIISDNKARPPLRQTEYNDFLTENPGRSITFIQSANRAHDRYIVLDEGTKDMKVYHCGASSKFDESLWAVLVDSITVHAKDRIVSLPADLWEVC